MIECILATDMANHAKHYNAFKTKLESLKIKEGENFDKLLSGDDDKDHFAKNTEVQQLILSQCVHTSDLSSPAKSIEVCDKMLDLVYIEFFNQGDKEKELGLPVSMLCDRTSTNVFKSQVGFIKFVVKPQFVVLYGLLPEIKEYIDNLDSNLAYYEKKVEKQERNVNRLKLNEMKENEEKVKEVEKVESSEKENKDENERKSHVLEVDLLV